MVQKKTMKANILLIDSVNKARGTNININIRA